MSSWQPAERRLEILKDPHTGAFAVLSCGVYFLMYLGVYFSSVHSLAGIGILLYMENAILKLFHNFFIVLDLHRNTIHNFCHPLCHPAKPLVQLEILPNGGILLECVSNLAANEFFGRDGTQKGIQDTTEKILEGIRHLKRHTECLVIVTNEVCSDLCRYSAGTEAYRMPHIKNRKECDSSRTLAETHAKIKPRLQL